MSLSIDGGNDPAHRQWIQAVDSLTVNAEADLLIVAQTRSGCGRHRRSDRACPPEPRVETGPSS